MCVCVCVARIVIFMKWNFVNLLKIVVSVNLIDIMYRLWGVCITKNASALIYLLLGSADLYQQKNQKRKQKKSFE